MEGFGLSAGLALVAAIVVVTLWASSRRRSDRPDRGGESGEPTRINVLGSLTSVRPRWGRGRGRQGL